MKNILERNDKKYLEIEKFENYELTSCIAYEMAIRNDEYRNSLINTVSEINDEFVDYNNGIYSDRLKDLKDTLDLDNVKELFPDCKYKPGCLNSGILINLSTHLRNFGIVEDSYYEILKIKEIQHFEIIKYLKDTYNKKDVDYSNDEVNVFFKDKLSLYQRGSIEDDTFILLNDIKPDFQRPFLKFQNSKHTNLLINLSFQAKELIEYIKHIKKTFSNHDGIKTPNELKNIKDFIEYDKLDIVKRRDQEFLADYFFCYDFYKKIKSKYPNMHKSKISQEIAYILEEYYNNSNYIKTSSAIVKAIDKMHVMIEEKGYLKLLNYIN